VVSPGGGALSSTLILVLILSGLGVLLLVLRPEKPGEPAAQTPRERTIELALEDGAMGPVEVEEGDRVRLRITT